MKLIVALAVVALAGVAAAQPALPEGKALPDASLADGTVLVKVIRGELSKPASATVTITVGSASREAATDANGRARFEKLPAGAAAQVSVNNHRSDWFEIPAKGGVRVLISTELIVRRDEHLPTRDMSGYPMPASELSAGSLDVRLLLAGEKAPPATTEVTVVGYAADNKVTIARATSDAAGVAHFTKLDTSGRTTYYAMALLARGRVVDRLASRPIVLEPDGGEIAILVGEARGATWPAEDARVAGVDNPAAGKVAVVLEGATSSPARVDVVDAATGKALVSGTAGDIIKTLVVDVAATPGRVLFAEVETNGERYRSRAFLVAPDRGAVASVLVGPRVTTAFDAQLRADEESADVVARLHFANASWIPYAGKLVVPLPRGAKDVRLRADDPAKVVTSGIELVRPVPPTGMDILVGFTLRGTKGDVAWSLELPYGGHSAVEVVKDPGVSVDVAADVTKRDNGGAVVAEADLPRGRTMALTVHLPSSTDPVQHACRPLRPDRSPLVGKPAPDFALADVLKGGKVALSSLRGKTVQVNFIASWDHMSTEETPKLVGLAKQVPALAIVRVASDHAAADVVEKARLAAFPVLLDPPPRPDDNIGAVTTAWGTHAVPESFVIDRKGVVRLYFANQRDWDKPDAIACLKAVDAER